MVIALKTKESAIIDLPLKIVTNEASKWRIALKETKRASPYTAIDLIGYQR